MPNYNSKIPKALEENKDTQFNVNPEKYHHLYFTNPYRYGHNPLLNPTSFNNQNLYIVREFMQNVPHKNLFSESANRNILK